MHPIITAFINTNESLEKIILKYHDKDQYLESVFLKLLPLRNIENIDIQLYSELDKAIIIGHPDSNYYFIFISFAIGFTCSHSQFERAQAIQSIGFSLSQEKIHPTVQAYFLSNLAFFKHW